MKQLATAFFFEFHTDHFPLQSYFPFKYGMTFKSHVNFFSAVVTKKWSDSDQVVTLMNTTCSDFLVQEAGKYLKKQNL